MLVFVNLYKYFEGTWEICVLYTYMKQEEKHAIPNHIAQRQNITLVGNVRQYTHIHTYMRKLFKLKF